MDPRITPYTGAHLPAVAALAARALDLPEDAGETDAILARLLTPPPGRRTVRLAAVDDTGDVLGVVLASVRDDDGTVGHLDLVAVHPAARQRGVARALVTVAEKALGELGVSEVRIAGNAPCYAWPGIDVRYTPAICTALALGYEQVRTGWNMTVELAGLTETADAEARLAALGIGVRRAGLQDTAAVEALARTFGEGWAWEAREAITRDAAGAVAGCHIALRGNEILGFAAFGALRPSLFGPMGTLPAARGTGIGNVLLCRCLGDQRAAGLASAQIGWAGPLAFYTRAVGARIERVFVMYRKDLP